MECLGYRVGSVNGEKTSMVESRCGAVALGRTYLLPPLSSGGASMVPPWLRFHIPLIEPDGQIASCAKLAATSACPRSWVLWRVRRFVTPSSTWPRPHVERTILTGCGPVTPQPLAVFFVCIAIRQSLPSWTEIGVLLWQLFEVGVELSSTLRLQMQLWENAKVTSSSDALSYAC
jgi:hypothetical protein